jgi:O-methyltransferase
VYKTITTILAGSLSPESLHRVRSIKRAIMGESQLPPLTDVTVPPQPQKLEVNLEVPGRLSVREQPPASPSLQDVALKRYAAHKISAPFLFYDTDDILILAAHELARTLTLSVLYLNSTHVDGDVAEFGTMGGFSARTLAAAMVYDPLCQPLSKGASGGNPFRKLRLFDSFEGLPDITSEVDLASPHVVSGTWSKGGCKILGARELRTMVEGILPPERIEMHPGWFADTVKALPPETRFAMIHFDGDLYQSMMDALTPCFERGLISRGAVLCLDDWNCNKADPSYGERRAWKDLVDRFQIVASNCGDYATAATRFIIHTYNGMLD